MRYIILVIFVGLCILATHKNHCRVYTHTAPRVTGQTDWLFRWSVWWQWSPGSKRLSPQWKRKTKTSFGNLLRVYSRHIHEYENIPNIRQRSRQQHIKPVSHLISSMCAGAGAGACVWSGIEGANMINVWPKLDAIFTPQWLIIVSHKMVCIQCVRTGTHAAASTSASVCWRMTGVCACNVLL